MPWYHSANVSAFASGLNVSRFIPPLTASRVCTSRLGWFSYNAVEFDGDCEDVKLMYGTHLVPYGYGTGFGNRCGVRHNSLHKNVCVSASYVRGLPLIFTNTHFEDHGTTN